MSKKPGDNAYGSLVRSSTGENPDEDEIDAEDGVLFYVNKGGFPIPQNTWERMWNHVAKIHPDGHNMTNRIRYEKILHEVAIPQAPLNLPPSMPTAEKLELIQSYMSSLEYNHTGTQFFEIKKYRPISGLMDSAKEMIRESLPIKCLEAVILGLYLTNGMPALDRFTISFKTTFNGNTFRHVVLGVYSNGNYGALGMSRRQDLMYKPLRYKRLSDIALDYEESYSKYWHTVKKIKFGLPIPHDSHSYETINWKFLSLNIPKMTKDEIIKETDKFAKDMKTQKTAGVSTPDVSSRRQSVRTQQSVTPGDGKSGKKTTKPEQTKRKEHRKGNPGFLAAQIKSESAGKQSDQHKKPVTSDHYQIRV